MDHFYSRKGVFWYDGLFHFQNILRKGCFVVNSRKGVFKWMGYFISSIGVFFKWTTSVLVRWAISFL